MPFLALAQCGIRAALSHDAPNGIRNQPNRLDIAFGIGLGLVADPGHHPHQTPLNHGDADQSTQAGMALGQAMLAGCIGIIVVDNGCALAQGIGPNTGLADRVMAVISRRAIAGQRVARPVHQFNGFLVIIDEMNKGDLTACQLFGQFLPMLHEAMLIQPLGHSRQGQQCVSTPHQQRHRHCTAGILVHAPRCLGCWFKLHIRTSY